MIGISLSATIGIIAFLNARVEGSRAALNGLILFLLMVAALILSKRLGVDWKAVFLGLGSSYSTLAMAFTAAISLGAVVGLLARWSLRWNLTPVRVGLVYFAVSLLLINAGTLLVRLKEMS